MEIKLERVLIANRGEVARRLIRFFRERDIETVVAFAELEADFDYLDDADYAVYLNGRSLEDTFLSPRKVISAAMDAGCDAVHPGTCFLAERADFYEMAATANLAVIGMDARQLVRIVDRAWLRGAGRALSLPLIPATERIPEGEDGVAQGAQIGLPLFVKAVAGGALQRVSSLEDLPAAVGATRAAAQRATGDRGVYLERVVEGVRHCSVPVVRDRHDHAAHLGVMEGSVQSGHRAWIEEMGPDLVSAELRERLCAASLQLARAIEWVGVGTVRWVVTADEGWYLLGFSARLTTGFSLIERVHGVDLLATQLDMLFGAPLEWSQEDAQPGCHGIQLRIFHLDPADGSRPEGTLERLELPSQEGVMCEVGAELGQRYSADTDPLLLKLTVTAPTRQAALVKAGSALKQLRLEGVASNLAPLREVVGSEIFWSGKADVATLGELLDKARHASTG